MLLSLPITLLLVALLYWAATAILGALGIGEPITTILKVTAVLVIVFALLRAFGLVSEIL